jgi:hypothetical protein
MKIHQLSLFLENGPGHLRKACDALAAGGIDILTLALADTEQFGILRLIVRDWEKARDILKNAGCVVNITEVVAVEVQDCPGGLAAIIRVLYEAAINIEYMYAFTFRRGDKAVLVFRFADNDQAIRILEQNSINVVSRVELFDSGN